MAQGFKSKAPSKPESSLTRKKTQPKDMKKGGKSTAAELDTICTFQANTSSALTTARTIPPKKAVLVNRAMVHKKNTSSHGSSLEKTIATAAISRGKLTILRSQAEETDEGRKALKKK